MADDLKARLNDTAREGSAAIAPMGDTWLPLSQAPMYVYGRDALVGQWITGYGWKKVSIWEPEWTREDILGRGGTHWWPHLRELPEPAEEKNGG